MNEYGEEIASHYVSVWGIQPSVKRWKTGPAWRLPPGFCVLEFRLMHLTSLWAYATCCMSQQADTERLELFLYSPAQYEPHVELLTVICDYHRTGHSLGWSHTVNFGRPWMPGSKCDHGLISLPYRDGPKLEHFDSTVAGGPIRFLWLLPITEAERDYKKKFGIEALECKFDTALDYWDPGRQSLV